MNFTKIIVLLILNLVFLTSCTDDDEDTVDTPKTLLETHQENLNSIQVGAHNLTFLDYGPKDSDKVLILLHGVPTSSLLYRNVAEQIAKNTGFRVLAPDLLGFGGSDKPVDTNSLYSFNDQAQRLFDFATALDVKNFVLGVHDSGGFVGWTMMIHTEAERIDGLLITDTLLEFDGFTSPSFMVPIFTQQQTPAELWGPLDENEELAEAGIRSFLEGGIFDGKLVNDELVEAYSTPLNESSETYIVLFNDLNNVLLNTPTIKTAFSDFNKPVAIVWGKEDAFMDATIVPQLFQNDFGVPANRLSIIEGAGHYLQEDKPDEYVKLVSIFLNEDF